MENKKEQKLFELNGETYTLLLGDRQVELDGIIYKHGSKLPKVAKDMVELIAKEAAKPPVFELDFGKDVYYINTTAYRGKKKFNMGILAEAQAYEHLAYVLSLKQVNQDNLNRSNFHGKDFDKASSYSNVYTISGKDFPASE